MFLYVALTEVRMGADQERVVSVLCKRQGRRSRVYAAKGYKGPWFPTAGSCSPRAPYGTGRW